MAEALVLVRLSLYRLSVKKESSPVDHIVRLIEEIRNIRGIFNINSKELLTITINADSEIQSFLSTNADVISKLGGLSRIEYNQPVGESVASIIMPEMECYLALSGIDVQKEKKRLLKEIDFLAERIDEIKYRLNNPSYVNKATSEIQQREKKRLEAFLKKKEGIQRDRRSLSCTYNHSYKQFFDSSITHRGCL